MDANIRPDTKYQPDAANRPKYVEQAQSAFEIAVESAGELHTRTMSIAGLQVTFRFAGTNLIEPLTAALSHHPQVDADGSGLVVSIWDAAGSGVAPPTPVVVADGTGSQSRTGPPADVRIHFEPRPPRLAALDSTTGHGYFLVEDPERLPHWEVAAPLRCLFHWWMADHGRQLTHAAAVGNASGGVLLVEPGGVGKSSTSLACLNAGLDFAGDDYCLVSTQPEPQVFSLYCSAKLRPPQVASFPDLRPALTNADKLDSEKGVYVLSGAYPDAMRTTLPLRAIVVPSITGTTHTYYEPLSPALALRALAPSTIFQLEGAGGGALRMMSELVRKLPCYRLCLGTDRASIAHALEDMLSQADGG